MYENCKRRLAIYNATPIEQYEKRKELLVDLLGQVGEESYIEPPFYCDYGKQITVGAHFYANYGCVMVDTAPIIIGDHVLLGRGSISIVRIIPWIICKEGPVRRSCQK